MEPSYTINHNSLFIHAHSKLHRFYLDQLKDIYWAEKKLLKTLPKLSEAATSNELKNAFQNHQLETRAHVDRLEQIFTMLGAEPEALKCPAMAGILEEGEDIIQETDKGTAQRDVGLIFTSQKAEHYEIATYGGLIAVTSTLEYLPVIPLLQKTLDEEKNIDRTLSQIATGESNLKALSEKEENEW